LKDPNGLLAFGGDLSVARLLTAYGRGIFPWFNPGQPILWWTPDPRTVFFLDEVHCSRSMQKFLRQSTWRMSVDTCFDKVVEACAGARPKSSGTWISSQMQMAYSRLYDAGYAHSAEVWEGDQLVGGLYGVAIGKVFFGESMFSVASNASKFALIRLSRFLRHHGFELFDAQVASEHLFTMGARTISRRTFEELLSQGCREPSIKDMQSIWHAAKKKLISDDGHILDQALRHT
jgi:leucyl/phenylalanyl-tRNA--protein transferase